MGRREQRKRERKRAASTCQTLDRFLPAAKRVSAREDPETIVYSLISGPQTFPDFFYEMKVCEETVLCS